MCMIDHLIIAHSVIKKIFGLSGGSSFRRRNKKRFESLYILARVRLLYYYIHCKPKFNQHKWQNWPTVWIGFSRYFIESVRRNWPLPSIEKYSIVKSDASQRRIEVTECVLNHFTVSSLYSIHHSDAYLGPMDLLSYPTWVEPPSPWFELWSDR